MKAVIMAGGFGTRLRPLTCNLPKPMVCIANKPMMEHIVTLLKKHGFSDLVVLLYFQAEDIISYFGDGSKWGVKIQYVTAAENYGTAGSVKNAQGFLNDRFLVISGDVLTDVDLREAVDFHVKKQAQATMVLTRKENPLPYGVVITSENGEIDRFLEKPTWGEVFSDTVNTGIYILEPEILEKIPQQKNFDFSKNLFKKTTLWLYYFQLLERCGQSGRVCPGTSGYTRRKSQGGDRREPSQEKRQFNLGWKKPQTGQGGEVERNRNLGQRLRYWLRIDSFRFDPWGWSQDR
jgi:NDP-sugar pyrophosphorylase family protein